MSMLVTTSVTIAPRYRAGQLFDGLPVAQGALDGRVEAVQAHPEQLGGAVVARQQVGGQRAHERADEAGVLAGDGGGHAAADRGHGDREVDARAPEEQGVADALDELARR